MLFAALLATQARAAACAEKLDAFDKLMMVSRFTAEGAARMRAARAGAVAHQKAGRVRDCVRVLTQAMGRQAARWRASIFS
ncbi:MAG: hypothetical protein N2444_01095 [Methylocystis sp.]|nr:hypothetical protein [Methylocystis sp.]